MKYHAPYGSTDPDASYVDKDVPGAVRGSAVPAAAIEDPQREIVDFLIKAGLVPADGKQLASAVQAGKVNYADAGGAANALTATLSPAPTLTSGFVFRLKVSANNTGAATLALNGGAVTPIIRADGTPTQKGDLIVGQIVVLAYDGTKYQLVGVSTSSQPPRQTLVYTAPSSSIWTPTFTGWVHVKGVAGGGGGGGGGTGASWSAGGGGAGGAFEGWYYVTSGVGVSIVVGSGGIGGANSNGAAGASGGTTSFAGVMSAVGGAGGQSNNTTAAGGAGGSASGGQINYRGAGGGSGVYNNSGIPTGFGGASIFGGGGMATTLSSTAISLSPGAGGGGIWGSGTSQNGGNGADGQIIITH
ncbi:hypothetical protein [Agrobacterium deltaense]|uniref:glycine-rich domain-containing protein n=1 Tax=Agrobacterium deltaense TaxID=1183412 RepID=UPI0013C4B07C|nr:hypothetical protein [Agrobacterium deltaense]